MYKSLHTANCSYWHCTNDISDFRNDISLAFHTCASVPCIHSVIVLLKLSNHSSQISTNDQLMTPAMTWFTSQQYELNSFQKTSFFFQNNPVIIDSLLGCLNMLMIFWCLSSKTSQKQCCGWRTVILKHRLLTGGPVSRFLRSLECHFWKFN